MSRINNERTEENQVPHPESKNPILDLQMRELRAWREALGASVDLPDLPDEVTPELLRNLDEIGFSLFALPQLDPEIFSSKSLYKINGSGFRKQLIERYPHWKVLESKFWSDVKRGNINFPNPHGAWLAVETIQKPELGLSYKRTQAMEAMGLKDYFGLSAQDANKKIREKFLPWFLEQTRLPNGSVQADMLTALEWNMLAQRNPSWVETHSREFTSSRAVPEGRYGSFYAGLITLGDSRHGDGTQGGNELESTKGNHLGFRPAARFVKSQTR